MSATNDKVSENDRRVLRELGRRKAEAGAAPVHDEKRRLWTRLNDLESERPMVFLFEVPWHEMEVDGELALQCEDPSLRRLEQGLRRELYQWEHMPADMIVKPVIEVPPALRDTGFGIGEKVDVARTDEASDVVSRHFNVQIQDEADIEKIQMPEIELDREAWDRNHARLSEIFDGVIPVEKSGVKSTSVAPWDLLVRLTGVEQVYVDMMMRPDYIHKMIDRMTEAFVRRLEQHERLNVLAQNNDVWLGGGYDFTDELPPEDFDPARVRAADMWGRTMSQNFSEVSPDMHEEFALQYECRYLNRFGLTYYGCCEPLHHKVDILRRNLPNLRKISMSPWIKLDQAAENVGTDYVFSYKPNPAVLATDVWSPEKARAELDRVLGRLEGAHVELIMKDISTVRYEPQRLWEWAALALEAAERHAS